jgi:hypothetical protein
MKKEFIGYYTPTEEEINDSWANGTFSFDANSLLNLYRYTELTRKDFLGALKTLQSKLFLPHQAALEYHNNRLGVIEGIKNSYSDLYNIFKINFKNNLESELNKYRIHPAIKIESILKLHYEFLEKISVELDKEKKNHLDFKSDDKVLIELTDLFENAIGKEFSKQELKKIFDEGKERYLEKIPPGFKDLDKQKKGERYIYGDLIVWKELIEYTKREKRPIIFVTDDRKEDWWTIENGKTIRPREELIKEFFDLTGIRILIYKADNFLHYAKEKKYVPTLKENTIKEVKEIRVSDEKSYATLKDQFNFTTISPPKSIIDALNARQVISDYINDGFIAQQKTINEMIEGKNAVAKTVSDWINGGGIPQQRTVMGLNDESGINTQNADDRTSKDLGLSEISSNKPSLSNKDQNTDNNIPDQPPVRRKKASKKK